MDTEKEWSMREERQQENVSIEVQWQEFLEKKIMINCEKKIVINYEKKIVNNYIKYLRNQIGWNLKTQISLEISGGLF